ncbi:MAG: hypothetical protein ABUS79_32360 [Pseudomonadota bacterium]
MRPDVVVTATTPAMRAWWFGAAPPATLRAKGQLVVTGSEAAWRNLMGAFRPRAGAVTPGPTNTPSTGGARR